MSDEDNLEYRFQNLHEFVTVARQNLNRNNWDYLIGGSETETTLARNRMAIDAIGLRPRVLRDVSDVDCSKELFGKKLRLPVLCAPVGSLENFEPGGGATVAAATAAFGNGIILSSVSHPGLEKTAEASGNGFKIFQLYVRGDEAWVDDHVHRAAAAGYDAFCLTVDTDSYSRRERDIAKRHERRRVRPGDARIYQARFNWKDIERVKRISKLPVILKGIATHEDATIAVDHGVDCVYVSNHGGRQLDQGVGSLDVLPEVVEAVKGRAKIMIDGGFYRGTDIVKAIILGADAVACGRLYVYGLAAAGGPGVVRLFEILEDEVRICLSLLGVTGYAELDRSYIRQTRTVFHPHVHSVFPHLNLPKEHY
ncbi:MAG: alpha-hydroxy-acid oxidizing protein [Alphaproteobacteria bacterium]|nr:alpha-hydroxy-acid oxidizing protein [Alphaproteobacteria bacterium]MBV9555201.1 alpha-hydroxy-acid oxidizing protein [Alphaproteobacteria bacterium]